MECLVGCRVHETPEEPSLSCIVVRQTVVLLVNIVCEASQVGVAGVPALSHTVWAGQYKETRSQFA